VPTGRIRRSLPVAGLAARSAAGRAANLVRRREDATRDQLIREATRYVALLGEMKGVAMKVGQLVSFLDASVVPAPYRAAYQQVLATLQSDAPPMAYPAVEAVVRSEFGAGVADVFAWLSPEPMAAASIGQVHAAELPDGRSVAVKVQYPGVREAIAADLANTELLAGLMAMGQKLMGPLAPRTNAAAVAEEIRDRVTEELDYRIEAANQAEFAARYRGHPFIHVPDVMADLSTERVLVSEMADGMRWGAALREPQPLRDRWGEVINRFVYASLYRDGLFNADPHPGNYLFHSDGTVTFLDFGCVKRFTREQIDFMTSISLVVVDGDGDALRRIYIENGIFDPKSKVTAERLMAWYMPQWEPTVGPQPWRYTAEYAAMVIERCLDIYGEWGDVVRSIDMPGEFTFITRIQLGLFSVLAALEARGDWRALFDEVVLGQPPRSELGRLEAQWQAEVEADAAEDRTPQV